MVERQTKTLGDYCTLQRGTTYNSRLLGKPGPILLGLATIQRNGGFRRDSLQTYGGESPDKLMVQPGELYLSLKDVTQSADLLGAVARLPIDQPAGRLTQDTVKLVPRSPEEPLEYLYWLLQTPQYRNYCRARATGTTNLGLAREDFLCFPAPMPTAEQLRIVRTLNVADEKIELNRRMAETLEKIARTLFKSWFVDFDPVCAKSKGRPTGVPDDLSELFPDRFGDDGMPIGWGSTAASIGQLVRETVEPQQVEPETPYLGLEHFDRRHLVISRWGHAREVGSVKMKFSAGDLLFGKLRPYFRKVAIAPFSGICSSDIFVFRPVGQVPHSFLYLAFSEDRFVEAASNASEGTKMPRADWDFIKQLPAALPAPALLLGFEKIVAPVIGAMLATSRESQTLADLRETLLPKLVSGELRIADAEKRIAAA